MSDNKKYYYMRLKDNFFDSEELKSIEALQDGHKFSNILLKMYLRSLKRDGKLMLTDSIPYDTKMLAKIVGHTEKNVKKAIDLFVEYGLVEVLDSGAMYMLNIQEYIGSSSSEADRQRNYRKKISTEKKRNKCHDKCYDVHTPEIEIEIEKEKEIEIDIEKKDKNKLSHTYNFFCEKLQNEGKGYPNDKIDKASAYEGWKALYMDLYPEFNERAHGIIGNATLRYLENYRETNTKDGSVDYTYLCFLSSLYGSKSGRLLPFIEEMKEEYRNDL